MIKKLVHTADWHLKQEADHDQFIHTIDIFCESIIDLLKDYSRDEVRICIPGDTFDNHDKTTSTKAINLMAQTKKRLSEIFPVIETIGNHDYDINNREKLDYITPIHTLFKLHNNTAYTFKKHSECWVDDNIVFCNYSNYDFNERPDIEKYRKKYPNKTFVGLYHDMIMGSKNFYDFDVSSKSSHKHDSVEVFEGCDFVLMGDIHKHQVFIYGDNNKAVYCGSLSQINYGETVEGHGYCIWDVESKDFEFIELDYDYGLYKIVINSFDDITKPNVNFTNIR